MKYLCLAYYEPKKMSAMAAADVAAMVSQCPGHDRVLRESGRLFASASLGEPAQTRSIRPGGHAPLITDGPFVETKEQVGGFFIIEADNLDDALRVASLHPAAHLGSEAGWGIEVRPIGMFLQP
jgi:hypothetical protein